MADVSPHLLTLFTAARERPPGPERVAYLDGACGGDVALRAEVEALLAVSARAGGFLAGAVKDAERTVDLPPAIEVPGTVIGPYKLVEQIGAGGMGSVWMAQQTEPVKRLVAVKLIKPGMDSRQVLARFEAERQALALMDHPNIAKVLDAGATDAGRPYFVMDLVKGMPITKYCDEHHLTPRQRMELFIPVCQAVQHAHQKGIIHRDIKPSNILVALYDGRPVPKVIDFGIAKAAGQPLTDKTLVTGFGAIVGTLEYMSPEQAELNQLDVDTRSDIYSLGVLLYELLAGSPPFTRKDLEKVGMLEMLRVIREQEPSKPSTKLSSSDALPSLSASRGTEPAKLTKLVRGELDWIVMKALEKDRNRRYETANGFAADVQRYLADEPVLACPPSALYRFRKFARRNKRALVTAALLGAMLLVLAGGLGWVASDRAARQARTAVEVQQFLTRADSLYEDNKLPEAMAEVQKARGVLESGDGDEKLREQVKQWVTDLDMAERLEEIRLEWIDHQDYDRGYAEFARAFRDYGIDVEALLAEEVRARVAASRIKVDLALALGNWAGRLKVDLRPQDPARWQRLRAIARAANPDPWEQRLEAAVEARDVQTLRELANGADPARSRTRTLAHLGSSLSLAGDVEAAVAFLRKAQRQHPGDFSINASLAFCLGKLEPSPKEEIISFRRVAVALRPRSHSAHGGLGYALFKNDRHDEAIAEYREAIRLRPNDAWTHSSLGAALYAQKKLDEAIAAYREAIRLKPDYVLAHSNLGGALRRKGLVDEAIAEQRETVRLDPKNASNHHNLAVALGEKGLLDEAIDEYREAIRLKPGFAGYHMNLSKDLRRKGLVDEAIAEGREAVRLAPDSAEAHDNLGYVLKNLDEGIACHRKAIELDPNFAHAHYNLGTGLLNHGKLDEAIVYLRRAVELDPVNPATHNNLGNALRDQKRLDEAIASYRKAIELAPQIALPFYNLGKALRAQRKPDEAVAAFRKAIELDPKDAHACSELGALLCDDLEDYVKGAECFRKAIELDPKAPHNHVNLGLALANQKKLDEAVAAYRKAIEIDPKHADAYCRLGNALRAQKKLDEAIVAYRKAIELNPKSVGAQINLGVALYEQTKFDEAIAAWRKAIEIDPKDAVVHNNLGSALKAQGKLDEAVAAYRRSIELNPRSASTHSNLGLALQAQKKLDEAIAAFRKAIELDPKIANAHANLVNAVMQKGWALANNPDPKLRDPKRSVELCKEAVELVPQSVEAWQWLGWVQYRAGNWKASIEALEKSCRLQPGGTGDCCQWIVMALAHWKLADEKGLPEQEQTRHKAEARRRYDAAVKQLNTWGTGGNSITEATRAFRAEAAELLGVNQAIKSLEELAAAQPNAWEPRVNLAQAYAKEGKWEEAAAEYTKAIEVKPEAWEPWSGRAFVYFHRKQWDKAIADFSKAIDLAPQVHTNWWHRGHIYRHLEQWDKAAADFGTVVEKWPDGSEGWYLRAIAFAQSKQPEKAVADLRQAIAKGFNNLEALKNEPKLAPLRTREDFGKLLEELERKQKSKSK